MSGAFTQASQSTYGIQKRSLLLLLLLYIITILLLVEVWYSTFPILVTVHGVGLLLSLVPLVPPSERSFPTLITATTSYFHARLAY